MTPEQKREQMASDLLALPWFIPAVRALANIAAQEVAANRNEHVVNLSHAPFVSDVISNPQPTLDDISFLKRLNIQW